MSVSHNTIAVLLILALVFAGIGVGIAVNNYQATVSGQFTEVPAIYPSEDQSAGHVSIEIVPNEEGVEVG